MSYVVGLTFNPFQENTYLIYDDSKECIIIDPGCFDSNEQMRLEQEIERLKLKPVRLINTHCHLDHIFGNRFVSDQYKLPLETHEGELQVLKAAPIAAQMYGIPYPDLSPDPERYIKEGEIIEFGKTKLLTLFTPGHSPASISFYCADSAFVIAGDVLFQGSIGRTDLPGGDYDTLIKSIREQIFTLPDEVKVFPGHGPSTNVVFKKKNNTIF